ncbi:MAG: preprotein translocase subunit SecE [Clostridia bacterium]|nr:preprotein translocase subunit SecE [Clostridia bacterium]
MKTGTLLKKWTVALFSVLMMISLFAIPVLADDGHDHSTDVTAFTKTETWILLGIFGVLLIAAIVLCVIFREKVGKFLRVYKSESKKIVWLTWNQTKKSTLVVLVVLVVCAVAICLIDLGLSQGFIAFINLFK